MGSTIIMWLFCNQLCWYVFNSCQTTLQRWIQSCISIFVSCYTHNCLWALIVLLMNFWIECVCWLKVSMHRMWQYCAGSMSCMVKGQVIRASSINFSVCPTRLSRKNISNMTLITNWNYNYKIQLEEKIIQVVQVFWPSQWLFSCLVVWRDCAKKEYRDEQSDCKSLCERWYLYCSCL